MDLSNKLNTLSVPEGPERISWAELTDTAGYTITAARQHVHATFGPSVILEIAFNNEARICFMPKRYAQALSPGEITDLGGGGFKVKCLGIKNKSPILEIFKAN